MSTYVAVFALVLAYIAVVAAYIALRTLAKLRRATAVLARGSRGPDAQTSLIEAAQQTSDRVEVVAAEVADLRTVIDANAGGSAAGADGLRNVALVRYDAFGEMSGRMSFSLALLDDSGDGVTISAIAGRSDTRVYAKAVSDGRGEQDLSPEERQAISSALGRRRGLLGRRSA